MQHTMYLIDYFYIYIYAKKFVIFSLTNETKVKWNSMSLHLFQLK